MDFQELISLSRRYGGDRDFVIAGGGNTSVKVDDRMWVKASGHALATIDKDGFVEMDLPALRAIVHQDFGGDPDVREERFKEAIYAARIHPEKGQRPSVECVVHALFPHRLVVHTHATYANMISCHARGEELARELWGDEVVWVPYVDPGFILAKEIHARMRDASRPMAMVWQNHGFTVAAATAEEVDEVTWRLLAAVMERLPQGDLPTETVAASRIAPRLRGEMARRGEACVVRHEANPEALAFSLDPASRAMTDAGPLIPDQIVYCKSFPLWANPDDNLQEAFDAHLARTGFLPKVVLVPGEGFYALGPSAKDAQDTAEMYADGIRVMRGATAIGGLHPMAKRDREFIDAWEVEQYRRAIAKRSTAGRLAGKVALVTGAGQGFGKGIAESLAAEGAHVVVADVNLPAAQAVADEIVSAQGRLRATATPVDVGSAESARAMVAAAVEAYGGVDLLVSNAGVLRAGSVKSQDPDEFAMVTRVNYQGYFHVVQAVAPTMAHQNAANPGGWTDVVQINSKSGLQGSNRNGAYSGGKFGGIGLTQSFALELVEDGIKVNAVCPGNFFEGPLWSDPENGLFAQYLRSGKVPGATSIDDVRRFYESKVPMGRGCRVEDVVRAILYLVEQEYETGQALPVTGGQVMLS